SIADFKGRGVGMNFWATWCVPCIREMPALSRLKELVADHGIDVLALSVDRGGAKVVRPFLDKQGITNLDILLDKKGYVMRKVGITGLPVTILIDADGIERGRVRGIAEWDSPAVIGFLKRCIGPAAPK
ncbi:MAG: TlpA family protein disulfide reductase, partial [Rhodospirillaceae bacterium]|nr:TlpA family protein disulfide reductase [Rhodospirillaceae bacterium]